MAKETFTQKHKLFRLDIEERLKFKACKSTTKSKFKSTIMVLRVKNCEFVVNGRYITEVSQHELIDSNGYAYQFNVLTTEELCELADELL